MYRSFSSIQSGFETIPGETLFEIARYLDPDYLLCLGLLSKTLTSHYDQNLRLILAEKLTATGFDWKLFSTKNLYHLWRVISVPHQLNGKFFVTSLGQVYNVRSPGLGQKQSPIPIWIPMDLKVDSVSMSNYGLYTLFLMQTGQVYARGYGLYKQMGLPNRYQYELGLIELFDHLQIIIRQVSAGGDFSLFLTNTGQVYSCGLNHRGQLGLGDEKWHNQPELITAFNGVRVVQISAGDDHSLFLTSTGQVYVCGENEFGQLGLGAGDDTDRSKPELITFLKDIKVVQVAAGELYSLFLSDTGQVYVCGAVYDKLFYDEPILIKTLSHLEIIQVSAGNHHSLFLTKTGQVYAYGENFCGQLGLGHRYAQSKPQLIEALSDIKIIQVSAGDGFSLFLAHTGHIYTGGYNGSRNSKNRSKPVLIKAFNPDQLKQMNSSEPRPMYCDWESSHFKNQINKWSH